MDYTVMFLNYEDPDKDSTTTNSQTLAKIADEAKLVAEAATKFSDLLKLPNSNAPIENDT